MANQYVWIGIVVGVFGEEIEQKLVQAIQKVK